MFGSPRRWMVLVGGVVLSGCPQRTDTEDDKAAPEATPQAPVEAKAPVGQSEGEGGQDDGKAPAGEDAQLGSLSDGVLPLTQMIGRSPQEVEEHLGEPTGKGMMRKSCVRHVPDKVWFRCDYAWQRYQTKDGEVDAVQVSYEDGKATAIALEGLPGFGPFDPKAALELVGLDLPGEPRESSPAENTRLWSWFNDAARLRIGGQQYRVEVSSVGQTWKGSKVELILNEALTEAQKAKRLEVEPKNPDAE